MSDKFERLGISSLTFRAGEVFARHTHDEGQFAYATTGAISMFTDNGNWIVPAQKAIWVPAQISHEMYMHGSVKMINAYVGHQAARMASLPVTCQAYGVSSLLSHLFDAMLTLGPDADARRSRLESILLDEMGTMPRLSLNVPLPQHPQLAKACRYLLDAPTQLMSIDEMARLSNMSRRTFTRQFRSATGTSFLAWKQQVCILEAYSRLSQGASVKDVSVDLGYCSTSAFSAAFKAFLGDSPIRYLANTQLAKSHFA